MLKEDRVNIADKEFAIDWEKVKYHLFRKERIPADKRTPLIESADRCIQTAKTLAEPRSESIKKRIKNTDGLSIELEGGIVFHGGKLSSFIKGAEAVYIFLVTIGPKLENEAMSLMRNGRQLEGYLLDSIGSLAVESFAEDFEHTLRKMFAERNMSVSMRLSPGYCDWPIEEQFKLAEIIDFSKAEVALTESCMMIPRKSITAMVGIGQKELFVKINSPCELCGKADCSWRRSS